MSFVWGLGLAGVLVVILGGGVWLIRRAGKKAAEGEQAKAALDTSKRIQDVPQPLPGETEDALRKGRF
jgi:hypothetical protein